MCVSVMDRGDVPGPLASQGSVVVGWSYIPGAGGEFINRWFLSTVDQNGGYLNRR